MSHSIELAGCGLAAVAALLPLRRPAFVAAVAVGVLLWILAAVAGGAEAARPLAAACVLLVVLLARRLLQDRRRAEQLLDAERALRGAAEQAAAAAERERIARDLHDGLTHLLTGQLLVLRTAEAALEDGDLDAAGARVRHSVELTGRALAEARDVVCVLAGTVPDLALVRDTVASWEAVTGRPAALDLPSRLPPLAGAAWVAVLAALREALTNAARHAPGSDVRIQLVDCGARLRLVVESQLRQAVATSDLPPGAGTGLQGLRERAALAGGQLSAGPLPADGRPGKGWRVELTVPTGSIRAA
ncbi:sensor histidine kinase [Actinoplanes sp. CA-030573]|uniref:sensor histidine kinase n=1 Tax=Actinoplanes sp. CA-030573 TaxID=3239898 RepID=UPI003D8AEC44